MQFDGLQSRVMVRHRTLPVTIHEYATTAARGRAALAYWNDLASDTFTGVTIDAEDPDRFQACMRRVDCDGITLANPRASASTVTHTSEHAQRDRSDAFLVHLQTQGRSLIRQAGRETVLCQGDFALTSTDTASQLRVNSDSEVLAIKLPGSLLRQRLGEPGRFICLATHRDAGMRGLIFDFALSFWSQLGGKHRFRPSTGIGETLADIVALAYQPAWSAESFAQGSTLQRLRNLTAFIDSQLHRGGLTLEVIADVFGVEADRVRRVLAETDHSLASLMLERRLFWCCRWLGEPGHRHRSLAEIAGHWGFTDRRAFNRIFRRRFGCLPAEFRRHPVIAGAPPNLSR